MKYFLLVAFYLLAQIANAQGVLGIGTGSNLSAVPLTYPNLGWSSSINTPILTFSKRTPLVISNSTGEILRIDSTGFVTVRGKSATNDQVVEALREWAMQNSQTLR